MTQSDLQIQVNSYQNLNVIFYRKSNSKIYMESPK